MSDLYLIRNAVLCFTAFSIASWIASSQARQAAALEQIEVSAAVIAAQGKPPILFKLDDGPAETVLADALHNSKKKAK